MKYEKTFSGLFACLLAVCIAMGGVGCMLSGLQLQPDDPVGILLVCALSTGVFCICSHIRRGSLILACLFALVGGYLWREGTLALQLESLIYRISVVYNNGYQWGIVNWSGNDLLDVPIDMGVGLIACLCAATIFLCLRLRKSILPGVIAGFLPLASCMVVTDSVPDTGWLFLLLTGLLIMIVTNAVRRRDRADGMRLTALMLIPAVLASALLFHAVPQEGYQAQLSGVHNAILSWFRFLPFVAEDPYGNLIFSTDDPTSDETDLTVVGPQTRKYYAVMDVTTDYTGALYLRGQSYDAYDGKSWDSSYVTSRPSWDWPDAEGQKPLGSISISTRKELPLRYFPYYPTGENWYADFGRGHLTNPQSLKEYTYQVAELDEAYFQQKADAKGDLSYESAVIPGTAGSVVISPDRVLSSTIGGYSEPSIVQCLQLPEATKKAARLYLQSYNLSNLNTQQRARFICQVVSNSAAYSLNTARMPADEADFAIWFLQNSSTGYCVHFATAATVLLRAAGIPAKYVTGYACQVYAGQTVTVNASKAHAWIEYYDDVTKCWRALDPTPVTADSTNPNTYDPYSPVTIPPTTSDTETTPPTQSTVPVPTQPTIGETSPVVTEPTQTVPTQPTDDPAPAPTPPQQRSDILLFLWIGGSFAAAALLIVGQYSLRRRLRRKRLFGGAPNAQALARWQEALRYGRILKAEPPQTLMELAEKAKFSQHTLSAEELAVFDAWLQQASSALQKKPLPIRLFWMLVLAVE